MLDRVDSLVFAAPLFFHFMRYFYYLKEAAVWRLLFHWLVTKPLMLLFVGLQCAQPRAAADSAARRSSSPTTTAMPTPWR